MLTRFPGFLGENGSPSHFLGRKRSVCPFFGKIQGNSTFYGGLARVQGRRNDSDPRPREQGLSALDGKDPLPVFTSVHARKQSGRRDGLSPVLEETTRTEGAFHASTNRGVLRTHLTATLSVIPHIHHQYQCA